MRRRFLCLPVDLPDDPRVLSLRLRCGDLADCYLVRLWSWAVRQSPDGMIGVYDDGTLEAAIGWRGDAGAFIGALRAVDLLLPDGQLADWTDLYRVEADRSAVAARVAKHRAAKRQKQCNVTVTEFSLSLNSSSSDLTDRGSVRGKEPAPPATPAPRPIPQLSDPWHHTDPSVLRAYLLAIPGPAPYLALPDPSKPTQTNLDALRSRFPAWDGQDGRPTVDQRAEATWDALRARVQRHTADPFRALTAWEQWVGDRHDQAAQRLRRATGADDTAALLSPLAGRIRAIES